MKGVTISRVLARPALLLLIATSTLACATADSSEQPALVRRGDDVLATGNEVVIADSVPGDLMVTAGDVRFTGITGGDLVALTGNQRIEGRVSGSIRAAAGNVEVAGQVGRNVTLMGGNVEIGAEAVIERNAYLMAGNVAVTGEIRGALQATGGAVTVNGPIGGDVGITAGELRIGPRAVIAGDLRYSVPAEKVAIDSAARITGEVVALPVRDWGRVWLVVRILWAVGFLLTGAVLVALFAGVAAASAAAVREHAGLAAGVGAMWLLLVPIAATIVAITVIGIPLAVITMLVWLVLLYVGRVALAVWIGRQVLGARAERGRAGMLLAFLAGAVILLVAGAVPIVGPLVTLGATVVGVGALLIALRTPRSVPSAGATI